MCTFVALPSSEPRQHLTRLDGLSRCANQFRVRMAAVSVLAEMAVLTKTRSLQVTLAVGRLRSSCSR